MPQNLLEPAFFDTIWTIFVVGALLVAAGLSLIALPWREREIRKVHDTALALFAPRDLVPAGARSRRVARR